MPESRDPQVDLALCNAATRGPWKIYTEIVQVFAEGRESKAHAVGTAYDHPQLRGPVAITAAYTEIIDADKSVHHGVHLTLEDAEFIAAAREALPHYIKRTVAAEAEVERLRRILQRLGADDDGRICLMCTHASAMTSCDCECRDMDHYDEIPDAAEDDGAEEVGEDV